MNEQHHSESENRRGMSFQPMSPLTATVISTSRLDSDALGNPNQESARKEAMNDHKPDNQALRRRRVLLALGLAGLLLAGNPDLGHASHPVVTKLHGRATTPQADNQFGQAVALSDQFLLVGEAQNDDVAINAGAAHLYDARTGRYLRKLTVKDGTRSVNFGVSVALSGSLAIVGSFFESFEGAVYGFDVRTGRQLWRLDPVESGSNFGRAVAASGDRLLVGAPEANDSGEILAGRAYVYDLTQSPPALLTTLSRGAAAESLAAFGGAVALSGRLAVVGPSGFSSSLTGFATLYDIETGEILRGWTDGDQRFGRSVAIGGGRVLIGTGMGPEFRVYDAATGTEAPYSPLAAPELSSGNGLSVSGNLALVGEPFEDDFGQDAGAAYLYDLRTGARLRRITAPDVAPFDYFAGAVALCGNRALIGSPLDSDLGYASGSAYFYRDISGPLPLPTLTQTRNFAPGTEEADFLSLLDPVINPQGETAFAAALTGPGAGAGTARRGIWSDAAPGNPLRLTARGGTDIGGGVLVNATGKPIYNRAADLIFQGSVRGTGVNGSNNTALFRSVDGGAPNAFLRKGFSHPNFAGAVLERFLEVSQSHTGNLADVAVAFQYRFGPGGVSPISDTGILAIDHDGFLRDFFNEDWFLDSVADTIWAQFTPRSSMVGSQMTWSAFLKGPAVTPANNMGLFRILPGAAQEVIVARKGDAVFGGGAWRTFLAEAINPDEFVTYRASLSGAGVENEKLQFGNANIWTKGDLVDNIDATIQPGARIVRVLKFWPADLGRVVFLSKLAGPGVNASNDCALWLWDDGETQLLMREGEAAPDCDGARIGVIQRVDVDPRSAHYVILASLTGNPVANQALFTGDGTVGNATTLQALRLPAMKLRKGTSYQAALGETTRLLSLSLTNTNDRFGAGAKGGPQVINLAGEIAVSARFTNRAWELLSGKP